MGVIADFGEFDKAVRAMYAANPISCRFTIKSAQANQELILKATDGFKTLKFRAEDSSAIKRIEKLTRWMIDRMVISEVGSSVAE